MEKIVYIHGSGRSADTKAVRRMAGTRELRVFIGPWTIRPARRTPVNIEELAKYEQVVLQKLTEGVIQIENGIQEAYTIEQVKERFASLRSSGVVNYGTMPYAELLVIMRSSELPSQEVWDAFVEQSFDEQIVEANNLPSVDTRITAIVSFIERHSTSGLSFKKALALVGDVRERVETQRREAEAARHEEQRAAMEAQRVEEAKAQAEAEAEAARQAAENAPVSPADEDQMDFSAPTTVEEPVATEPVPAPATEPKADRSALLPEGWRSFSNNKLKELCAEHSIALPASVNKTSLVAVVEAWAAGGS